jgi:hypothetical protein
MPVITLPGVDFHVVQAGLCLWPKLDNCNHSCPYTVMEYGDFHGGEEIAQTVFAHMVETPWIYPGASTASNADQVHARQNDSLAHHRRGVPSSGWDRSRVNIFPRRGWGRTGRLPHPP